MSNIINFEKYESRYFTRTHERLCGKTMKNRNPNEIIDEIRSNELLRADIPECANMVLNTFGINADEKYVPIIGIMHWFGIKTYKKEMTTRELSAYISVNPEYYEKYGSAKIACVNEKDSPGHMRFALAHELAHYIFDYNEREDIVYYNTYMKDSIERDADEIRANKFAANLLMPRDVFIRKTEYFKEKTGHSKPEVIVCLADHFGVLTSSIIKRFDEVGIDIS